MDEKIEKGDVVKLTSGGPNMTVEAVDGNEVKCVWFPCFPSGDFGELHREIFRKNILEKVSGG